MATSFINTWHFPPSEGPQYHFSPQMENQLSLPPIQQFTYGTRKIQFLLAAIQH